MTPDTQCRITSVFLDSPPFKPMKTKVWTWVKKFPSTPALKTKILLSKRIHLQQEKARVQQPMEKQSVRDHPWPSLGRVKIAALSCAQGSLTWKAFKTSLSFQIIKRLKAVQLRTLAVHQMIIYRLTRRGTSPLSRTRYCKIHRQRWLLSNILILSQKNNS